MTGHPSSPLVAAIGLVATAADGLRQLPRALGAAGQSAARRYDELAERGRDVLAGRPHAGSADGAPADLDTVDHAPSPAPTPGTTAGSGGAVGGGAAPGTAAGPSTTAGPSTATGSGAAAGPGRIAEATAPGGGAAGAAPPIGRTEPVVLPEDVQEEVAQRPSGADLAHDELPLADFDHQTLPQLRGRLRTLDLAELVQLRDYEQAHAARLPVLTLLDNRIARLLADTGQ